MMAEWKRSSAENAAKARSGSHPTEYRLQTSELPTCTPHSHCADRGWSRNTTSAANTRCYLCAHFDCCCLLDTIPASGSRPCCASTSLRLRAESLFCAPVCSVGCIRIVLSSLLARPGFAVISFVSTSSQDNVLCTGVVPWLSMRLHRPAEACCTLTTAASRVSPPTPTGPAVPWQRSASCDLMASTRGRLLAQTSQRDGWSAGDLASSMRPLTP